MSASLHPLAGLWGLPPVTTVADPLPLPLPRAVAGVLDLGGSQELVTSGGVIVRLPATELGQGGLAGRLEAWAYTLMSERYAGRRQGASLALRTYYAVRPLLPRPVQLAMRRIHARRRADGAFLRWPIDGLFVALAEAYLALRISETGGELDVLRRAPPGFRATAVLTHDVEGTRGQERCRDLAHLEREAGVRSCYNFVAERYPLDLPLMDELRRDGFEIGLHGIRHDGRKFQSREIFESRLVDLRRYRDAWQVAGFRSPATHRRWEWMHELPFEYDSSIPENDPYEPVPGGCGSPWPFLLGPLVELPITLPQDHTAWEILRRPALPLWREKTDWLRRSGGLVNIIVHPDYLDHDTRWKEYADFLRELKGGEPVWIALPREVARWWRQRETQPARLLSTGGQWRLEFA